MCEICTACRMFCGWLDLWMGSVFPHYVTGLFISLMANDPDSCEGFSPRPVWSTHPLTCLTRQTQKAARSYGLNVCVLTYLAPCCLIHGSIYHYKRNAWWATAGVNATLEIRGSKQADARAGGQEVVGLLRVSNGGMPLWGRCRSVWFSNMTL